MTWMLGTSCSRGLASNHFIIQLCCYADMLQSMTGKRPTTLGVVLGNGETHRFRTSDFHHYYLRIRKAFLDLMLLTIVVALFRSRNNRGINNLPTHRKIAVPLKMLVEPGE